ncbi:MAG: hypothetical protein M3N52_04790 [Actinomycetota bacterium]|nr:hypothetical protein [Actinomycetota bacterium]
MAARLEHIYARNMAALRTQRGWTQAELALRMTEHGLRWSVNRVSQVETLHRSLSPLEIVGLTSVFEVPHVALLAGDDEIELPDGSTVPLAEIRTALEGGTAALRRGLLESVETVRRQAEVERVELDKLGRRLGLSWDELNFLATEIYGRSLFEEREARTGDVSGLAQRSAQTKRGHATRALLAELGEVVEQRGVEAIRRDLRKRQQERLDDLESRIAYRDLADTPGS